MKDSFKNTFTLDGKSFQLKESRKNILKNGLYLPENPLPLLVMNHLLKNALPLHGKTVSSGKKIKENTTKIETIQSHTKVTLSPNYNL